MAKKRNLAFELTFDQAMELIKQRCKYCQSTPSNRKQSKANKNSPLLYQGIDRVDNSLGYTIDNCVPCCRNCNWAKSKMQYDEFIAWVSDVYKTISSLTYKAPTLAESKGEQHVQQ